MNIKEMITNANARRPYWIDTAVFFSESIARRRGGTRWAAGVDAMPQLPGMTCTPTAGGNYRYVLPSAEPVPTESPDDWKKPRLAILAQYGIPVRELKSKPEAKPAPAKKSKPEAKPAPAPAEQACFQFEFEAPAPKPAPKPEPEPVKSPATQAELIEAFAKMATEYRQSGGYAVEIRPHYTGKSKFLKIICCRIGDTRPESVHSFINTDTGDIYKSASWQAPAKNTPPRGNINNPDGGASALYPKGHPYAGGIVSLR